MLGWWLKQTVISVHNMMTFYFTSLPHLPFSICFSVFFFPPHLVFMSRLPRCPWYTANAWLSAVLTSAECSRSIWPGDKCWKGPINMDAALPLGSLMSLHVSERVCVCLCSTPLVLSHHVPTVCLLTLTEIHSLPDGAHQLRLLTKCQRAC